MDDHGDKLWRDEYGNGDNYDDDGDEDGRTDPSEYNLVSLQLTLGPMCLRLSLQVPIILINNKVPNWRGFIYM